MRRRFIQHPSGHALPSPEQPEQNRACAYQGPGGRLGHCSGEDGRVRIRLISPIADLPDVQSDILNVDPDVVETRTHTQSNSGIGIRVALKITEGANG